MAQNALAVRHDDEVQVNTIGELRDLAADAASSRFFGAATTEQALCLMMAGKDLGFSYMQSLRLFHVINNKPTLSADALMAICKAHESCEKFHRVSESDTESTWVAKRRGEPEQTSTFTIEDARRAKLLDKKGGNWEMYPRRMLAARAKAFLARDVWPDLVAGLYSPDEVEGSRPLRVESDVRAVPESRPTPKSAPAPDSGTREADDVDARLDTIKFDLDACTDAAEVAVLLAKLVDVKLPKDHPRRRELMAAYAAAQSRTKPVPVPVEVERQPGEEG